MAYTTTWGGGMAPGRAHFSIPSIIAIVCVIASFFVHAGTALVLAGIALVAGVIGFALALLPGVRGGVISVISMVLGGLGAIIAIFRLLARL